MGCAAPVMVGPTQRLTPYVVECYTRKVQLMLILTGPMLLQRWKLF